MAKKAKNGQRKVWISNLSHRLMGVTLFTNGAVVEFLFVLIIILYFCFSCIIFIPAFLLHRSIDNLYVFFYLIGLKERKYPQNSCSFPVIIWGNCSIHIQKNCQCWQGLPSIRVDWLLLVFDSLFPSTIASVLLCRQRSLLGFCRNISSWLPLDFFFSHRWLLLVFLCRIFFLPFTRSLFCAVDRSGTKPLLKCEIVDNGISTSTQNN